MRSSGSAVRSGHMSGHSNGSIHYHRQLLHHRNHHNHGHSLSAPQFHAQAHVHGAGALAISMATSQVPTLLPPEAEVVGLVGEGLANAVFAFSVPRVGLRAEERSAFRGKLLRLQKAPRDERANQFAYPEVQRYWEDEIRPLFRDPDACLVRQQLVIVKKEVAAACNRLLVQAERDGRESKFHGDLVREGPQVAMLVDDMRPPLKSPDLMGEFKPKWLTQSPSAPPGSVRCRTCATYLRRFLLKPEKGSLSGFQKACRLRLCDDSPSPPPTPVGGGPDLGLGDFMTAADGRRPPPPHAPPFFGTEVLFAFIRAHPLMRELRAVQARLDTCGPLTATLDDAAFQKAMTLRDCTCYVYVSLASGTPVVSVRLGDLDRKDGDAKGDYWRRTEKTLIEGGFYTARRLRVRGREFDVPVRCVLSDAERVPPTVAAAPAAEAVVIDVIQADKGVLEKHGQGIVVLATGREARIAMKHVDALHEELARLEAVWSRKSE